MTFSFKLNGHLVLVELRSISPYVSSSCARRLGLLSSGVVVDGAISVSIGNNWATCIVSLRCSPTECGDVDVVLGWDWYGHLKELCTATGTTFPTELQRSMPPAPVYSFYGGGGSFQVFAPVRKFVLFARFGISECHASPQLLMEPVSAWVQWG